MNENLGYWRAAGAETMVPYFLASSPKRITAWETWPRSIC